MRAPSDPIETRHRQRLLSGLLVATMGAGFALDGYYAATVPGYWDRMPIFALARSLFIITLLVLNQIGWTQMAAAGTVVLLPLLIAIRLLGGLAPSPTQTLSYLELDIVLASLLFSVRGTVIVTAGNVVLLAIIGLLVPGIGADTVVVYSATSVTVAALLIAGIRHLARVERDRQSRLHASEARKGAVFETAVDCIRPLRPAPRVQPRRRADLRVPASGRGGA